MKVKMETPKTEKQKEEGATGGCLLTIFGLASVGVAVYMIGVSFGWW